MCGTARNAIIVVASGIVAGILYTHNMQYFRLIGYIPAGLPTVQSPHFQLPEVRNEQTGEIIRKAETFSEMVAEMGSDLIIMPLVALMENMAICKAFGTGNFLNQIIILYLFVFFSLI